MSWFKRDSDSKTQPDASERTVRTEGLWLKCDGCREIIWKKDLELSLRVCTKCGHHFRLDARARLAMLFDNGEYTERDASLTGVDVLTSAILEFPSGTCVFTCSMQLAAHQMMRFYGTKGFIAPEIPFNATPGGTSRITIDDGRDLSGGGAVIEEFPACDHYTLQGDQFSRTIREGGQPPVPLEDSLRNMAVIDAIVRSAETGVWVNPAEFVGTLS